MIEVGWFPRRCNEPYTRRGFLEKRNTVNIGVSFCESQLHRVQETGLFVFLAALVLLYFALSNPFGAILIYSQGFLYTDLFLQVLTASGIILAFGTVYHRKRLTKLDMALSTGVIFLVFLFWVPVSATTNYNGEVCTGANTCVHQTDFKSVPALMSCVGASYSFDAYDGLFVHLNALCIPPSFTGAQ